MQSKPMGYTEQVLFTYYDRGWKKTMQCVLITYDNGNMDLHAQTGIDHRSAIYRARKILNTMDLSARRQPVMTGPTGTYYTVYKRKRRSHASNSS